MNRMIMKYIRSASAQISTVRSWPVLMRISSAPNTTLTFHVICYGRLRESSQIYPTN